MSATPADPTSLEHLYDIIMPAPVGYVMLAGTPGEIRLFGEP